jgi:hypothetical protein
MAWFVARNCLALVLLLACLVRVFNLETLGNWTTPLFAVDEQPLPSSGAASSTSAPPVCPATLTLPKCSFTTTSKGKSSWQPGVVVTGNLADWYFLESVEGLLKQLVDVDSRLPIEVWNVKRRQLMITREAVVI